MPFAVATVYTDKAKAATADRLRGSPATYTNPPKYVAAGTGATGATRTAAAADTALTTELGEGRTAGTESTVTTTVTGDTYQTVGTITMTGTRAIDEIATFDASTVGNIFISATVAAINLVSGDSLAVTAKCKFS